MAAGDIKTVGPFAFNESSAIQTALKAVTAVVADNIVAVSQGDSVWFYIVKAA